jgi:hypothetical protein
MPHCNAARNFRNQFAGFLKSKRIRRSKTSAADAIVRSPSEHDPEKRVTVFPRDERGTRLRGGHARSKIQSAMMIQPHIIAR